MRGESYRALWVEQTDNGFRQSVVSRSLDELPDNAVTIRVGYSSLNYKDALSAFGHPGVTKSYPHTPGIDAAGVVWRSSSDSFSRGQEVVVTGFDLGMNTLGGLAEYICVPAEWVVPLPNGLSSRDAMVLGTAGFTAALAVQELSAQFGERSERPPILVTGASGGVGSLAIAILARLGYPTVASTGKASAHAMLRMLGADTIVDRQAVVDETTRPLLRGRWHAAIDTVGGATLQSILRSVHWGATVVACGNAGGTELPLSVFPFILRAARLIGVDSAQYPASLRPELWRLLAGPWKLTEVPGLVTEVGLEEAPMALGKLLKGEAAGRFVVNLGVS